MKVVHTIKTRKPVAAKKSSKDFKKIHIRGSYQTKRQGKSSENSHNHRSKTYPLHHGLHGVSAKSPRLPIGDNRKHL